MELAPLYVQRIAAWSSVMNTAEDWFLWASSGDPLPCASDSVVPEVPFVPALIRRRMSILSKMAVQVLNSVLPFNGDAKVVFISYRGEITRQLKVNSMVIEEGELMPAVFSSSVFNAPPALASIILGLKGGYSALYPCAGNFSDALSCAVAPLLTGHRSQIILVYADEPLPESYACPERKEAVASFAFAAVLDCNAEQGAVPFTMPCAEITPEAMLRTVLLQKCSFQE